MRLRDYVVLGLMALAAAAPPAPAAPAPRLRTTTTPQRVIALEGGRNFRDLGGYRTADGRTVRWRLLYRSGSMGGLTVRDYETLGRLGIVSVCDFRSPDERRSDPAVWQGAHPPDYWIGDAAAATGDLGRVLMGPTGRPTPQSARAAMIFTYRALPEAQAPGYRETFRRLVAGQVPLVFNCTAGKDRTGLAAALILTALGVPYGTVREDYALSNQLVDARVVAGSRGSISRLAQLPPDVVTPLLSADPAYLDAAFAAIRERYGSINGYLQRMLGVGPRERAILRRRYLA